ncbi:MAG: AraC family transcriptional regulator [Eubacteriales bacterium]
MFYQRENIGARIVSVLHMNWQATDTYVVPRNFCALAYRAKGDGVFRMGEERLASGQDTVFFMPAGVGYEAHYTDGAIYAIHFHTTLSNMTPGNFEPANSARLKCLFEKACALWKAQRIGYQHLVTAVFYEILAEILLQTVQKQELKASDCFFLALQAIEDSYLDPALRMESICQTYHISPSYFRKKCKEIHGKSPLRYITEKRLRYAEVLLASSKYSVKQAAFLSGFTDEKYFSRLVRKFYDCTPKDIMRLKQLKS